MSLIAFHKFLISTAILFCLGFSFQQFSEFQANGESGSLIMAIAVGLAAVALGYYLLHLRDFLRLPSRGSDTGTSDDAKWRPGNGGHPLPTAPHPLARPEMPRVPGNGHAERDDEEIREELTH